MRFLVSAAFFSCLCLSCQYPWTQAERHCADQAHLGFPVDLQAFADKGTLYPFGAHGGLNPEGHAGVDFILAAADASGELEVQASFSAEVLSITPETDYPGSSCMVMDSACVEVNLCHLHLDAAIKVGSKVKRGQRLGTVGLTADQTRYNLHFGTYSGPEADLTCPAEFLDPDSLACEVGQFVGETAPEGCGPAPRSTLLGRSAYPEAKSRELSVQCADGSRENFTLPAETGFCAPRLPPADRARMTTCLGSACAGVW